MLLYDTTKLGTFFSFPFVVHQLNFPGCCASYNAKRGRTQYEHSTENS